MATDFSGLGGAVGDIFSGIGGLASAGDYAQAASLAKQNAAIVKLSTGLQEQQQVRQATQVLGTTQAVQSASGGTIGGSALDTLKSNAQQLSINRALVGEQGLMQQNSFLEQAAAYSGMATAATVGGIGGIVGGLFKGALALGAFA